MKHPLSSRFAPNETLAAHLLAVIDGNTDDGSHDLSHILRVWGNVGQIAAQEGGNMTILTAATILHDCVGVPKNSPLRSSASTLAAKKSAGVLRGIGWAEVDISAVSHAIEAHSFSANIPPQTLEAKILQDADRLDAIGHIGIARCFYVSGRLNRNLYDFDDPKAANRPLDDTQYALDHFYAKLLRLSGSFQTDEGRKLAAERHEVMQNFVGGLLQEVTF